MGSKRLQNVPGPLAYDFDGTSSTSYIETIPKYNYRGQVRGSAQNDGGTSFGPYQVRDLDWLGRTVASATYTSEPNSAGNSYQAHSGATSGSSPSVQYAFDTSAVSNVYDDALRPTSTTYPNGTRQVLYNYGTSGSRSDLLSRMEKIQAGSTDLTQYAYNGAA